MRKYRQRQILELLGTLGTAQSEGLYAECQETALQIGEFIESSEGGGTKTVELLEDYCELLYNVSLGEKNPRVLKKQLYKIENSVKTELKADKIEMLFLPYKASMFDSLESIYLAAERDPDCDAYVVPIPYYDKTSDGKFGEMHCEDAEYPANIKITDRREYDIESRHPDVIFIHNPYDANNYVTSVHPDYYCEKLRGLTDMLVYVPYFVVADYMEEHFASTAGCAYSHRVIAQSERIRGTYREVYEAKFGKAGDKFLALGSPKFDKAINSKREDFTFPENWKRMSAGKKVVLYNTSVGALLSGDDKYLLKLKAVFEMFRNRDDVVLLWRPHPLSVTTYTTMRPQLLRDYEALVADYTQAGYGIFDDSPDMYCAIAASDAYFGDWSSLVALYGILGKPIMIQNAELYPENPAAKEISCDNRFDDGESFWFTAPYLNALYKADAVTREISYIGSFPGEKNFGTRLYGTISKSNEKLYFAPIGASDAGVYNIESGEFEQITEDERFNVSTEPFAEGEKGTAILTDAAYDAMKPLRERMFRENPEDFQTIYDCCITEGRIRRAGDFLDLLGDSEAVSRLGTRQREIFKGITNFPDGNSGAAIYEYCKRTAL